MKLRGYVGKSFRTLELIRIGGMLGTRDFKRHREHLYDGKEDITRAVDQTTKDTNQGQTINPNLVTEGEVERPETAESRLHH